MSYIIDFEVNGPYATADSILIALPDGAVSDHASFEAADTTVFGERDRKNNEGPRGEIGQLYSTPYGFPETVVTSLSRGQTELPDARYVAIVLTDAIPARESQQVRVTIPVLDNPKMHDANPVKIYHFIPEVAAGDPAVPAKVSMRTADLMINSVMVMEDEDVDDEYIVEFVAQKDFRTNSELVITMAGFGFSRDIVQDDVEIVIDTESGEEPRGVSQDSRNDTVTLVVPNPGIEEGETVIVTFFASAEITKPSAVGTYSWEVDGNESADHASLMVADVGPGERPTPEGVESFSYLSADPGKNTRYELRFPAPESMNTLTDEIVIELEDFTVPSSIDEDSIAVTVTDGCVIMGGGDKDCTTTPQDIAVSGEKIFITVGDLDKASDDTANDFSITKGEVIAVVIRQSAGIRNPTEAGKYGPVAEVLFGNNEKKEVANFDGVDKLTIAVPRILSLDEEDGGLGTKVNATGKGFKNGTSLTVFVDNPVHMDDDDNPNTPMSDDDGNVVAGEDTMMPNRQLDLGEDILCEASQIGGDDIGRCDFTVTHPTFRGGINYINAVDGRNGYISDSEDLGKFELTASISASPASGSPGEIILLQMVDFPVGSVYMVELSRTEVCGPSNTTPTCNGSVDLTGSGNFKITIPNWAKSGSQELRVTGQNDAAGDRVRGAENVVISGPQIQVTPGSVVANQRISLVGVGFSSGAHITRVAPGTPQVSKMSVGGKEISWARINGGQPVEVDSGGNWSAAVDLPLHEATTAEGDRTIRVTDSGGRTGSVSVVIAAREVTITPAIGRVGTLATVRGMNFPSKNDDGSSFNVALVYDAGNDKQTTVSAVPDASGRFEVQLRIPTTASIPSTNTVKVQFDDDDDVTVVTTVTHEVPEGAINLSQTSGSPGSTISISGVGFKSFVPVKSVMVGSLEVTPSPRPSTDSQGMMTFNITIPGLDVGIQTIEVQVGGTTASVGFTVTTSGVAAGNITESSLAVVNLGDNFVRSFNFNNDTKTWTFYSPEAPDDSTQTSFITGESYWILIGESQEVILNGKTRNLTCSAAGNCWNLIVW